VTSPTLLLIAHGSRDPRHAATVQALTQQVRRARPGLSVTTGYLDHCAPRIPQVIARLAAERRDAHAVAVPLLLGNAYHAKSDIPGALAESAARHPSLTLHRAEVLGPSPLLLAALDRRLAEAGIRPSPGTGVVLAAAGSSDPAANAATRAVAAEWAALRGWSGVEVAHASAAPPRVADAVAALRANGAERFAVAPYLLAPGLLPDRIIAAARSCATDAIAAPLGAAPEIAALLLRRYDESLTLSQLPLRLRA
jgi:sirohydrochlorin ferrochelatase